MRLSISPKSQNRDGFVLPVVLFGLVIMSTLAVAALLTSSDELLSSRAMRISSSAFYAAEGGLHQIYATWSSYPAIDSIAPGDSLDLGWHTLDNGASYRAVVHRWDAGDEPMYQVVVEGRGRSGTGGARTLSFALTTVPGRGYMLGECCDAPAIIKGSFRQKVADGGTVTQSGFDTHPPGWEDAGVCADTLIDKPGIIMADTMPSNVKLDPPDAVLEGDPAPMVQDALTDATFDQFGDLSWDEIKQQATIIIDGQGYIEMADGSNRIQFTTSLPSQKLKADDIYTRYNADGSCDTTHPMNWGSDDPDDACFNHFPVILMKGEVDMNGGASNGGRFYGQGIIIADFDTVAMTGAEIEFEREVEFRGITLGKGCVEIQRGAQYYGSVFLDATYDGGNCDKNYDLHIDCIGSQGCTNTTLQWSQCAVDRAIYGSGLDEYAEAETAGGVRMLVSRSFGELFE